MRNRYGLRHAAVLAICLGGCAAPGGGAGDRPDADGITEKYWKLVELNGQKVPQLEREPSMTLRVEGGRVSGFGGCNSFTGAYTLEKAVSRIRFGQIAATLRACVAGMDTEAAFMEALRATDNYSLSGDSLSLNRARMAPLARFEAVYLQ